MRSLEERLRPTAHALPVGREILGIVIIVLLAARLLPGWVADWNTTWFNDDMGQMARPYLLPALAMLLALRQGAIDLSVWMCFALGNLVAAWGVNAGLPAWSALALGSAAGLVPGAASALLVSRLRVPAPIVTLVVAVALLFVMQGTFKQTIRVGDDAFINWHLLRETAASAAADSDGAPVEWINAPLGATRTLLSAGVLSFVLVALLGLNMRAREEDGGDRRKKLFAALLAGGALSAAGGAIWTLGNMHAPVPHAIVGDLTIPAAALLAGAAFYVHGGGTLLAGILLPPAMLLSIIWRDVWFLGYEGWDMQVLLLIGMVLVLHLAAGRALRPIIRLRWAYTLAALAALAGLLVMASARHGDWQSQNSKHVVGLVLAGASLALCGLAALIARHKGITAEYLLSTGND